MTSRIDSDVIPLVLADPNTMSVCGMPAQRIDYGNLAMGAGMETIQVMLYLPAASGSVLAAVSGGSAICTVAAATVASADPGDRRSCQRAGGTATRLVGHMVYVLPGLVDASAILQRHWEAGAKQK